MLRYLYVENVLLIDKIEMHFKKGLTAITGDSGSGKSIILESLFILLGDRASQDLIRNDCQKAILIAEFDISKMENVLELLRANDFDIQEQRLIIKKTIVRDTSSRITINDRSATVSFIRQLSSIFIEIYRQMDYISLLSKSSHINIYDKYCNCSEYIKKVSLYHNKYKQALSELNNTTSEVEALNKDIEYLLDIKNDIEDLEIKEDEEVKLVEERAKIYAISKLSTKINEIISDIHDANLVRITRNIEKLEIEEGEDGSDGITESINNAVNAFSSALIGIDQGVEILKGVSYEISHFEDKISRIDDRIGKIKDVARKHRISSSMLFQELEMVNGKITQRDELKGKCLKLQEEMDHAKLEYLRYAKLLSKTRYDNILGFEDGIAKHLHDLAMENTRFKVNVDTDEGRISENGIDKICLTARINIGSDFKPIDEIASGGELSRIALAIKALMLNDNTVLIFDEIEAGLSSNICSMVAKKLKHISQEFQVINITHSPQIAARADSNYMIYKKTIESSTLTSVEHLDESQKLEEIAKMLSGDVNEKSLELARGLTFKNH
jgi:DNA repair protein RecN (Recombination protein N)